MISHTETIVHFNHETIYDRIAENAYCLTISKSSCKAATDLYSWLFEIQDFRFLHTQKRACDDSHHHKMVRSKLPENTIRKNETFPRMR